MYLCLINLSCRALFFQCYDFFILTLFQSKARRKKCICVVILVVVLAVIAIILAATLSNKN